MVGGGSTTSAINPKDPVVKYMRKVREEHAKQQKYDYSHVFRTKSRFDLIRLSCIIVGIELAYAAETSFVTPTLLKFGLDHQIMTMVWGISPLLGFFMAPILGSVSDRCRLRMGRRRPILIILSLGIVGGLIFIPYGKDFGIFLGDTGLPAMANVTYTHIVAEALVASEEKGAILGDYMRAIIFVIFGTILLDFNADIVQTPSRAYLLDVCVPEDHARALSTFTILAGTGGSIGYLLGGIDWESTFLGQFFGSNIKTVFAIILVVFIISCIITFTSFREIPLPLIEKDELLRPISTAAVKKENAKNYTSVYYIRETSLLEDKMSDASLYKTDNDKQPSSLTTDISINSSKDMSISAASEDEDDEKPPTLKEYLKSIVVMPKSMRILSLTNLLCWMGHLCYCLYFTDFVGEAVFGGSPTAPEGSPEKILYDEGVRYGCWGLSIYAMSCAIYSSLVEKFIKLTSSRVVYVGGILIYAIGMLVLAAWPTKIGVLALSITGGVLYATLFTMPYILVAKYHAQGCFKVKKGENIQITQSRGLGTDIAIISSMIFVAQLIVSVGIGSVIALLNSTAAVLYSASVFSIFAALAAMKVLYLD